MLFSFRKGDTYLYDWFEDSVLEHVGALERDSFGESVGVYADYAIIGASTAYARAVSNYFPHSYFFIK